MNEEVQNWRDALDMINKLRFLSSEVVSDELSEVLNKAADLMEPTVCALAAPEEPEVTDLDLGIYEDLEDEVESVFTIEITHNYYYRNYTYS